ncbi:hypothetical protein XA68_14800 [Ophiocordyceps unilateralis]|uniref:Uncharacterized protein n=1 Tax=Ophiocordyceps unilateralis TaxID=268505 RepID=A0A2A9P9M6_OPHUN|nr:hypothetical protein XA68_14800 [Ophiocordyceps unilateralis]
MAWFYGDKDKESETVSCKYTRRSRCYSPSLDERWYYADDSRSPFFSPLNETIVCYKPKESEEKCTCAKEEEEKCPCVQTKEEDSKKCPCIKKKEEEDKRCPCIKEKEEEDRKKKEAEEKKCPCMKKKQEDDKKCSCVKKKEEEAQKAQRRQEKKPEMKCTKMLSPRNLRGDGCDRFTFEVYDRTDGPIYRQHGAHCVLSLSSRSSIDDILRFLAPDQHRQKVMVRWCDGDVEELDDRIPFSEIRRYARKFYIKERKRARFG